MRVLRAEPDSELLLIQSHYVIQTKHLILSSSPSVSEARPDYSPSLSLSPSIPLQYIPPGYTHGFVITCLEKEEEELEERGGDKEKTEEDVIVREDEPGEKI